MNKSNGRLRKEELDKIEADHLAEIEETLTEFKVSTKGLSKFKGDFQLLNSLQVIHNIKCEALQKTINEYINYLIEESKPLNNYSTEGNTAEELSADKLAIPKKRRKRKSKATITTAVSEEPVTLEDNNAPLVKADNFN